MIKDRLKRFGEDHNLLDLKRKAAAITLLGTVAAGAAGCGASSSTHNPAPRAETTSSAPANPGETAPTPSSTDAGPVELSVERYEDGDALIRAYVSEYNDWMMSGATEENAKDFVKHVNDGMDNYTDSVAAPLDEEFINALFVSDWQSRPQLAEYIDGVKAHRHSILAIYLTTAHSYDSADKEPYLYENKLLDSSVVSRSSSEVVTTFRYEQEDNSDQNRANEIWKEPANGRTGGATITFKNIDGAWKISDIKY